MTRWDQIVPSGKTNASHTLENFILYRALDDTPEGSRIMMFEIRYVNREDHYGDPSLMFYKFYSMEFPFTYLDKGVYKNDGTDKEYEEYWIERDSTDARVETIYKTYMRRTKEYIRTIEYGDLYIYEISYPGFVLPPEYHHVKRTENHWMQNWFTYSGQNWSNFRAPPPVAPVAPVARFIPVTPVAPVIQTKTNTIPSFIFQAFVDMAEQKGEECPITMEKITKQNVGAPPCGHLFDKDALKRCLSDSGKCPTCRQVARENDIQTY